MNCAPRIDPVEGCREALVEEAHQAHPARKGTMMDPWVKLREKQDTARPNKSCSQFLSFVGFFIFCTLVLVGLVFMILSVLGVIFNVAFKWTQMQALMD